MSQSSLGLAISLNFWSIILLGLALFLYNLGVLAYEGVVGKVGSALSFYSGSLRQRVYLFLGRGVLLFWVGGFCVFFGLGG